MKSRIVTVVVVTFVVTGAFYSALRAQATRTVWDGVYTEDQAKRGALLFDRECAQCHGPAGAGGGMAPALVDSAFSANYDGQTVGDLFDRNRATMPIGKEGQLSGQQNADITAFMLQCNTFPSGTTELPSQSMTLKQIKYVAEKPEAPQQGHRPPGIHQDHTEGKEWIRRRGWDAGAVVRRLRARAGVHAGAAAPTPRGSAVSVLDTGSVRAMDPERHSAVREVHHGKVALVWPADPGNQHGSPFD